LIVADEVAVPLSLEKTTISPSWHPEFHGFTGEVNKGGMQSWLRKA